MKFIFWGTSPQNFKVDIVAYSVYFFIGGFPGTGGLAGCPLGTEGADLAGAVVGTLGLTPVA